MQVAIRPVLAPLSLWHSSLVDKGLEKPMDHSSVGTPPARRILQDVSSRWDLPPVEAIRLAIVVVEREEHANPRRPRPLQCESISVTLGDQERGLVRIFLELFTKIIHMVFERMRTEVIPPDLPCEGLFLDHRTAG